MVEHRTENPGVPSPNLGPGTKQRHRATAEMPSPFSRKMTASSFERGSTGSVCWRRSTWRKLHPRTNTLRRRTRSGSSRMSVASSPGGNRTRATSRHRGHPSSTAALLGAQSTVQPAKPVSRSYLTGTGCAAAGGAITNWPHANDAVAAWLSVIAGDHRPAGCRHTGGGYARPRGAVPKDVAVRLARPVHLG